MRTVQSMPEGSQAGSQAGKQPGSAAGFQAWIGTVNKDPPVSPFLAFLVLPAERESIQRLYSLRFASAPQPRSARLAVWPFGGTAV